MTAAAQGSMAHRLFSSPAVVASCAGILFIGMTQALYGPAMPAIQERFGVSTATAALSLSAHFLGALGGVLVFQRIHEKVGNRTLLRIAFLIAALGTMTFGTSLWWPVALIGAFLTGIGFGGVDYGLSLMFAIGFGDRGVTMLNVLHANYGVGSVLAPMLVGLLSADSYRALFITLSVLCLAVLPFTGGVRQRPTHPSMAEEETGRSSGRFISAALLGFMVLGVLHLAVQASVGGWEPTHLENLGYTPAFAATATSGYWLLMTIGRVFAVPATMRWSTTKVVMAGCVGSGICLLVAPLGAVAPIAYAAAGFFIGPILPTMLAWLNTSPVGTRHATAYVMAPAMVGGVAFPPLVGQFIEWAGPISVPLSAVVLSAFSVFSVWWIHRALRVRKATESVPVIGLKDGAGVAR
ncbi:MFS transporter [Streptomyces sp. NPDC050636]|uniref:MFS transporter n=1 Tax=Streptomyces sp. NPDC050636 TaxID=3154510 RepID=UPI00344103D4